MNQEFLFWLIMTLLSTMLMSFYSTQEMAAITYNRLRLEYGAKQGKWWAVRLLKLTENPTLLFSTTLIGVNTALMASSECARRTYEALELNPNLAPLTHIPFILILGELVPMFAARNHAEHMSRLGLPLLSLSATLLSPFARIVDFFFHHISRLTGSSSAKKEPHAFLNREELQKLIEEHEAGLSPEGEEEFDEMVGNIFSLKTKPAFQLMEKLSHTAQVASHTHVKEAIQLMKEKEATSFLIYHRQPEKIVGIVEPQDLVDASAHKRVSEYMRPVTFVSEAMHGIELLLKLQQEETPLAVVLSDWGTAIGVVQKEDLILELVGKDQTARKKPLLSIEKSISGDMTLSEFNALFGTDLAVDNCETFHEVMHHTLERHPEVGDVVTIEPFELIVKEISLFKAETIVVRSKRD